MSVKVDEHFCDKNSFAASWDFYFFSMSVSPIPTGSVKVCALFCNHSANIIDLLMTFIFFFVFLFLLCRSRWSKNFLEKKLGEGAGAIGATL